MVQRFSLLFAFSCNSVDPDSLLALFLGPGLGSTPSRVKSLCHSSSGRGSSATPSSGRLRNQTCFPIPEVLAVACLKTSDSIRSRPCLHLSEFLFPPSPNFQQIGIETLYFNLRALQTLALGKAYSLHFCLLKTSVSICSRLQCLQVNLTG